MRNKAEKQRRDRLNAFINELAKLIPLVARSQKRLDKTSILRLAATHLRIYQSKCAGRWKWWHFCWLQSLSSFGQAEGHATDGIAAPRWPVSTRPTDMRRNGQFYAHSEPGGQNHLCFAHRGDSFRASASECFAVRVNEFPQFFIWLRYF